MIEFVKHRLPNGMVVLIHRDSQTPMAVTNLVYNAGSKYDPPEMTGMAHLFEHMMFGGSKNAGDFDIPQQLAGGENNAYTNSDITNYYQILPGENLETALWLESDRMGHLDLKTKVFATQKAIVLEEYKETCLNEPYGDVWHYLHDLCYKSYPYRWPTIGMTPAHIESITLDELKKFYRRYYHPANAVLAITGNVDIDQTLKMVEKWFLDLKPSDLELPIFKPEEEQREKRGKKIKGLVPHHAVYMAFHIPNKLNTRFPAIDLLSDLLGLGRSCWLNEVLVEEKEIFSSVDAYVNGSNDTGLFIIEGRLNPGFTAEEGEASIVEVLNKTKNQRISERELRKLQNTFLTSHAFSSLSSLHKAMNLSQYENLGNANLLNTEVEEYQSVTPENIRSEAELIFREENCSVVWYSPASPG